MAIIDGIPGLEVSIEVDGAVAREFDPPDDERYPRTPEGDYFMLSTYHNRASPETRRKYGVGYRPHAVKYTESKPGAAFSFSLRRSPAFERAEGASGMYWMVEVDGNKSHNCHADDRPLHQIYNKRFSEIRVKDADGNQSWNRLRLGHLRTDDNDKYNAKELKEHVEKARQLGVLKVLCYHLKCSEKRENEPSSSELRSHTDSSQVSTIPEKALKGRALDCTVRLEPTFAPEGHGTTRICLDPKRRPFAIFEFKYRSMEGLFKEGILPRPRPTAPSRSPNPMKFKRERSGTPFGDDELEIVSGRTGRSYKSRRLDDGLLEIDLTEED